MSTSYHRRASSTGITEWPTPQWLVDQLAQEFAPGGFDLDPASTPENANAPAYFDVVDDGLAQSWHGRVWLNPPYGKYVTPRWLAKAKSEVDSSNAELVVCLVPARVETAWWREYEADPCATCGLRSRAGRTAPGAGSPAGTLPSRAGPSAPCTAGRHRR
jgi:phage N-6-adenine-methyltransferase